MPVFVVSCPDCGHVARTLVLEGCRMPGEWVCSKCNGRRARPDLQQIEKHPWEGAHGSGCLCCAPTGAGTPECSAVDGSA